MYVCKLVQCLYMCGLDLPDYLGNEEDHEQNKDYSNGEKAERQTSTVSLPVLT